MSMTNQEIRLEIDMAISELKALRKTIVRIHEYMESAADSGMIPMWMFEDITKIIGGAEGQ